jgi:hypothetical protein
LTNFPAKIGDVWPVGEVVYWPRPAYRGLDAGHALSTSRGGVDKDVQSSRKDTPYRNKEEESPPISPIFPLFIYINQEKKRNGGTCFLISKMNFTFRSSGNISVNVRKKEKL